MLSALSISAAMPWRLKHWSKLVLRPEYYARYREVKRLRKTPRYTRTSTNLLGRGLELVDAASFLVLYDELFKREIYRFETTSETPLIIDGGANIGLSTIYFKTLIPRSRVVAFEPDPEIFGVLRRNCNSFGLGNVEFINKALWINDSVLAFKQEGADAGRLSTSDEGDDFLRVPSCRLRDHLDQEVDLLKLDIEGAETEVLRDCADSLKNVSRLFVEYHSFADKPQTLHEILAILRESDFRVHMHCGVTSPHPFVNRDVYLGMDFTTNIFAFRS